MKTSNIKLINLALVITSLAGHLEYGSTQSTFLIAGEYEVIKHLFTKPELAVHPFTILPMLGQLLLLTTLFQQTPSKILTYCGIACIGLLLLFILFIGFLTMNPLTIISTLPFVALSIVAIRALRKINKPIDQPAL